MGSYPKPFFCIFIFSKTLTFLHLYIFGRRGLLLMMDSRNVCASLQYAARGAGT